MDDGHTTADIQRYLDALGQRSQAEGVVRALLERSAERLHVLCSAMLIRSYPRLMRPPLNLQSEEMLSAIVERLLKAMREVKPETPRQFFALANRHMRWELNDLARRLDQQSRAVELNEAFVAAPESTDSMASPNVLRMLAAIDELPEDEREVFDLVRIQGLTHSEVAELLGVATKTVQRRLNRGLLLLSEQLADLKPKEPA
jgi:RNA polymerase sigma-70 factor (ECF subfamily)